MSRDVPCSGKATYLILLFLICSSCLSLQPQSNQSWHLYNVLLAFLYHASKTSKQGSILSQTNKKLLSAGCWGILIFHSLPLLFDFWPVESVFWQSELTCWGWTTRGILSFKVRSFCQVIIHGQQPYLHIHVCEHVVCFNWFHHWNNNVLTHWSKNVLVALKGSLVNVRP